MSPSTTPPPTPVKSHSFWRSFGPGILFAGAAIGNSHLVQSTRAGAVFGLGLAFFILFANVIKFPGIRFGPQYAAATGKTILAGYRDIGRWVVGLFMVSEFFVMTIIIAASGITTAAVGLAITGLAWPVGYTAIGAIVAGAVLLQIGGYRLLDGTTKIFVAILTIATFIATALAIPNVDWSASAWVWPEMDFKTFAFIIALMGFMPITLNFGIVHSLWMIAKADHQAGNVDTHKSILDFDIGYVFSAVLAFCFLIMGAGVMHPTGVAPAQGGADFAAQVIALYTTNLGEWSGFVVGICAMMVMFTTLVTVLDGFPRAQGASAFYLRNTSDKPLPRMDGSPYMILTMAVMVLGSAVILLVFMRNFKDFIDFVTITSFLIAPMIAIFNHIVMTRPNMPRESRPSKFMQAWSITGIVALSGLSIAYLYMLLGA